jgi:4'-phosphopantetheinyl transferase
MYQVFLGKISSLSTNRWAEALSRHAPEGAHRARWLAGRGLLSRLLAPTPLPEIIHNEQGNPFLPATIRCGSALATREMRLR